MKIKVRTLEFPGDEKEMENIKNNDLYTIKKEHLVSFPKLGVLVIYLEYEDYSEDHTWN